MRLIADGIRPRDICTRKAFENAAIVIAATGGSTNGALHLPAMANEVGIDFDLFDVAEIFKRTPYIADLKPGGKYVAKDVYDIGGVPQILKALLEGGVSARRLPDRHRQDAGAESREREIQSRPEGRLSGFQSAVADGRRRRPQGHARSRWRDRQGRRPEEAASSAGRRAASTARRMRSAPSMHASTRTATSSSSATRARRAAPACARCCRPRRRFTARAPATRSR